MRKNVRNRRAVIFRRKRSAPRLAERLAAAAKGGRCRPPRFRERRKTPDIARGVRLRAAEPRCAGDSEGKRAHPSDGRTIQAADLPALHPRIGRPSADAPRADPNASASQKKKRTRPLLRTGANLILWFPEKKTPRGAVSSLWKARL